MIRFHHPDDLPPDKLGAEGTAQLMAGHGIKEKFHVQIRYQILAVHPAGSCNSH
jgi:hypothetical protein